MSLMEQLGKEVTEFRRDQALAYPAAGMLALIGIATFAGVMHGQRDLAAFGRTCSQAQLRAFKFRRAPRSKRREAPGETTFMRVLARVDAAQVERALLLWQDQVLGPAGRFPDPPGFAPFGSVPAELKGTKYRQLVIPPVRIFYRAQNEVVYIVYVIRGERLFRNDDLLDRDMGSSSSSRAMSLNPAIAARHQSTRIKSGSEKQTGLHPRGELSIFRKLLTFAFFRVIRGPLLLFPVFAALMQPGRREKGPRGRVGRRECRGREESEFVAHACRAERVGVDQAGR